MEMSGKFYTPAGLPVGKSPGYPLNRRLGVAQNQSECYGEKKYLIFQELNHDCSVIQPSYTD
jgi:hypothetical protein